MPMKILTYLLAAMMAGNGAFMFIDPPAWYAAVPGVPDTGPLNPHFVRDIGLAYMTAGLALAWSAWRNDWQLSALAALFIGGHALLHLGETALGHHHDVILNEIAAVHVPALLAIAISFFQSRNPGRT